MDISILCSSRSSHIVCEDNGYRCVCRWLRVYRLAQDNLDYGCCRCVCTYSTPMLEGQVEGQEGQVETC